MGKEWETTQPGPEEMNQFTTILGIRFFSGTVEEAAARAADGGLILAPSGPGLAALGKNRLYQEAVENCDVALPDSGFMTLLWKLFKKGSLKRLSGLKFLTHLILHDEAFRAEQNRFWIMPGEDEGEAYRAWLREHGISVSPSECYTAPYYDPGEIEDDALVALLLEKRPRYILVNLGGGVQEILGYYLRRSLPYGPAIICTGAAIAFLSGRQARIPPWADRFYLGWLLRCLKAPASFIPRYCNAWRLLPLLCRYGEKSPPAAAAHSE